MRHPIGCALALIGLLGCGAAERVGTSETGRFYLDADAIALGTTVTVRIFAIDDDLRSQPTVVRDVASEGPGVVELVEVRANGRLLLRGASEGAARISFVGEVDGERVSDAVEVRVAEPAEAWIRTSCGEFEPVSVRGADVWVGYSLEAADGVFLAAQGYDALTVEPEGAGTVDTSELPGLARVSVAVDAPDRLTLRSPLSPQYDRPLPVVDIEALTGVDVTGRSSFYRSARNLVNLVATAASDERYPAATCLATTWRVRVEPGSACVLLHEDGRRLEQGVDVDTLGMAWFETEASGSCTFTAEPVGYLPAQTLEIELAELPAADGVSALRAASASRPSPGG